MVPLEIGSRRIRNNQRERVRCLRKCEISLAVVTENSVRSENVEVTFCDHVRFHDEFSFRRAFGLIASNFRTCAALQAEILALHQLANNSLLPFGRALEFRCNFGAVREGERTRHAPVSDARKAV